MPEAITTSTGRQGAGTRSYLASLEAREDQALSVLSSRLRGIQANVQQDLDALLARVARAREAGEDLSPSWLYRERRYRLVLQRLEDDLVEAMAATAEEAEVVRQVAATRGRQFAGSAMGVEGTMSDWSPEAMRAVLAGAEGPTPLATLLHALAGESVQAVRVALITGVATGKGVPWMTRRVAQGLDVPRWRAETIVRTESMRAFRHATRASFQEALDVVAEWTWTAALDSRTCVGCLGMHGSTHPVTETLDGHPRCRCVMVPRTVDWADLLGDDAAGLADTRPSIPTGQEWLEGQPESVQRAVLGPGKFKAWKEEGVTLPEMVTQVDSPEWGTHRREASLREIRDRQKKFGGIVDTPSSSALLLSSPGKTTTKGRTMKTYTDTRTTRTGDVFGTDPKDGTEKRIGTVVQKSAWNVASGGASWSATRFITFRDGTVRPIGEPKAFETKRDAVAWIATRG